MEKEEEMRTGKFNSELVQAMKVILRRRAELDLRIASGNGSEQSLKFDMRERDAITTLLSALKEKNETSTNEEK
jgi:hypothetical protein